MLLSKWLTYCTWGTLAVSLEVKYNETIKKCSDSTASILFLTASLGFSYSTVSSQTVVMSMGWKVFSSNPKASLFNITICSLLS